MIHDISVPLQEGCITFPGDPAFHREWAKSIAKGDRTNLSQLNFGAHTGTHIDAPLHMLPEGSDVTAYPNDAFVGPAKIITITDPTSVTVSELRSKSIGGVKRVLFKTRNSQLWAKKEFSKDFVYLEPSAAQFLGELGVTLVGFDYLSIEKFGSPGFPAHLSLMYRNIVILEGLNLSQVHEDDYILFCGALRLTGAEGSPARAMLADADSFKDWKLRS